MHAALGRLQPLGGLAASTRPSITFTACLTRHSHWSSAVTRGPRRPLLASMVRRKARRTSGIGGAQVDSSGLPYTCSAAPSRWRRCSARSSVVRCRPSGGAARNHLGAGVQLDADVGLQRHLPRPVVGQPTTSGAPASRAGLHRAQHIWRAAGGRDGQQRRGPGLAPAAQVGRACAASSSAPSTATNIAPVRRPAGAVPARCGATTWDAARRCRAPQNDRWCRHRRISRAGLNARQCGIDRPSQRTSRRRRHRLGGLALVVDEGGHPARWTVTIEIGMRTGCSVQGGVVTGCPGGTLAPGPRIASIGRSTGRPSVPSEHSDSVTRSSAPMAGPEGAAASALSRNTIGWRRRQMPCSGQRLPRAAHQKLRAFQPRRVSLLARHQVVRQASPPSATGLRSGVAASRPRRPGPEAGARVAAAGRDTMASRPSASRSGHARRGLPQPPAPSWRSG